METNGLEHYLSHYGVDVLYANSFDALKEEVKETLGPQLVQAAALGFRRPVTDEFVQDVMDHLRGGELFVLFQEGLARGFALRRHYPELEAIYLAGAVKAPGIGSGVVEKLTERYFRAKKAGTLVTRTQNDRIVEMVKNICDTVVPLDKKPAIDDVDLLAKMGILKNLESVDLKQLIIKGFYGGSMIASGERARSKDPKIVRFTDNLDYYKGDAAILIGYGSRRFIEAYAYASGVGFGL